MEPRHALFRERALQEYIRTQEEDVHPHFVPSFVPVLFYILLCAVALVSIPIWWGEVPVFTNAPGIVLPEKASSADGGHPLAVTLFLPASAASQVRVGTSTHFSTAAAEQSFTGTVAQIHTGALSVNEARQRYMLNDTIAQIIPQSSVAVTVVPEASNASHLQAGDVVNARVQTGSQRVFSLLMSLR